MFFEESFRKIDPLENIRLFRIPLAYPVSLPVVSVVVETRPEMRNRILRITEWHRKWFKFHREIVVGFDDPKIPGTYFVKSTVVPKNWLQIWYSDLCVHGLSMLCDAPFLLVWQWDGFIINPELWTNEFLDYDYIGAPGITDMWLDMPKQLEERISGWKTPFKGNVRSIVGNGGFSLRSKRFVDATANLSRTGLMCHLEDFYLCVERRRELESVGIKFAPPDVAFRFAKEGPITCADESCFGFHSWSHFPSVKGMLESKYIKMV